MIPVDELNDYLQDVRRGIAHIARHTSNDLVWGYSWCKDKNDEALFEYLHALTLLRNQALVGEICLCQDEIDLIKSNINRILGPSCKTESKDFTVEPNPDTQWILNNPDCVAYEFLAEFLQAQCKKVHINFSVVKQRCEDVGIDLKITNKVICDAIDLAIDVEKLNCDIDLDVKINLHNCIVDVETVLNPLNCGIDLKTYVTLLDCGFTLKTILQQLNCGATVDTLLNGVDSCFTPVTVDEPVAVLGIGCPVLPLDTINCGVFPEGYTIGDFLFGLQVFTGDCDCLVSDGEGGMIPLPSVFSGAGFALVIDVTDGNIRTLVYSIPVECSGVPGEYTLTLTYDITATFICAPPPASQFTTCAEVLYTLQDPCGNTASCTSTQLIDIDC